MLSFFGIVPKGSALDIPNGYLGMIFYTYTFVRHFTGKQSSIVLFTAGLNLIISSLAIASSLFLARKLYVIRELCVVCVSTHIINTIVWIRAMSEGLSSGSKVKIQ